IDMDKKNIDLFNLKRPNDVNICVAVSDREGEADMYHYHDGSPINTIEKKLAESRKYQNYKIKKTRTISINKIVEDYKIEELDYVNIDTEGSEYKILKNFNFAVRPIIFSIEFLDIELNRQELIYNKIENVLKSDIYNLFIRNDYKFINWLHQDLIFVDKKFLN
ncbi:MAG: FkbM family methyltransferase, partial [Pelagibacteraceae bacterium]